MKYFQIKLDFHLQNDLITTATPLLIHSTFSPQLPAQVDQEMGYYNMGHHEVGGLNYDMAAAEDALKPLPDTISVDVIRKQLKTRLVFTSSVTYTFWHTYRAGPCAQFRLSKMVGRSTKVYKYTKLAFHRYSLPLRLSISKLTFHLTCQKIPHS